MKALLLISILVLLFGALSERLKRSPFTPPMVFVSVGLAIGYAGARLVSWCVDRGLMELSFEQLSVVVVAVLMSVYLHGATAWPASKAYGHACDAKRHDAMEEWMPAPELPTRLR